MSHRVYNNNSNIRWKLDIFVMYLEMYPSDRQYRLVLFITGLHVYGVQMHVVRARDLDSQGREPGNINSPYQQLCIVGA